MLDILQFIFSGFWVWCGFTILFAIFTAGAVDVLGSLFRAVGRKGA